MSEIPEINNRIKLLVEQFCGGNVQQFVDMVGIKSHQNLNRIFNIDKRSNKYPSPSSEILTCIKLQLPQVNYDWLLTGEGEMLNVSQTTHESEFNKTAMPSIPYEFVQSMIKANDALSEERKRHDMERVRHDEAINNLIKQNAECIDIIKNRLSALEKNNDSAVSSVPISNSATAGGNGK